MIGFGKRQSISSYLETNSQGEELDHFLLNSIKNLAEDVHYTHLSGRIYDFQKLLEIGERKGFVYERQNEMAPVTNFKTLANWERKECPWELVDEGKIGSVFGNLLKSSKAFVKAGYLAPEAFLEHQDIRSNVYSLGLLLSRLFSDAIPETPEHYSILLSRELDFFRWRNAKVKALAVKCLHSKPSDRITMVGLLARLEELELENSLESRVDDYRRTLLQFKSALLDYSPRNPLFHYNSSRSALSLDLGCWELRSKGKNWDFGLDDQDSTLQTLTKLRRLQSRDLREKGEDNLWAVASFLVWHDEQRQLDLCTPLLLSGVDFTYEKTFRHKYGLKLTDDNLKVNEVLRHYLAEHFGISLPTSIPFEENALIAFYADIEQQMNHQGASGWQLDHGLVFGRFAYKNISIALDYDDMIRQDQSDVVRQLLNGTSPDLDLPKGITSSKSDLHQVLASDPSQDECIRAAMSGSLVIEGPPGTGKSQVIANIIAEALARDKKVLFVSEKRPAIDVVYNRLEQSGIGALALLVHNQSKEKKEVIQSLKMAYESLSQPLARDARLGRQLAGWKLDEALEKLDHYFVKVRARNDGFSLNELFLRQKVVDKELSPDIVPDYDHWNSEKERLRELGETLQMNYGHTTWRNTGLVQLNEVRFSQSDAPARLFESSLKRSRESVEKVNSWLGKLRLPFVLNLGDLIQLKSLAKSMQWLIDRGVFKLVLEDSKLAETYEKLRNDYLSKKALVDRRSQKLSTADGEELSLRELESAQAHFEENGLTPDLKSFIENGLMISTEWFPDDIRTILRNAILERKGKEQLLAIEARFRTHFKADDAQGFIEQVELLQDIARRTAYQMPEFFSFLRDKRFPDQIMQDVLQLSEVLYDLEDAAQVICKGFREYDVKEFRKYLDSLEKVSFGEVEVQLLKSFHTLSASNKHCLVKADAEMSELESLSVQKEINRAFTSYPGLEQYTTDQISHESKDIYEAYQAWIEWNSAFIHDEYARELHSLDLLAEVPASRLTEEEKRRKWAFKKGMRLLKHEFDKTKQYKSLRELLATDAEEPLRVLKPVFLMSPGAVAEVLPCKPGLVDLVIFDEASQIRLEDVLPICHRAKDVVVVGDSQQLPPSDFFQSKQIEAQTTDGIKFNSFLMAGKTAFATKSLAWHYRSDHTALIGFSNAAFYQNHLRPFPSLNAIEPAIKFHCVPEGLYENRENRGEARKLAQAFSEALGERPDLSYAIVALSEKQQDCIEEELIALQTNDMAFSRLMDREELKQREGAYSGLIIRNLENMQGEERDVVFVSLGYGFKPDGKMATNFGPIMHAGGERRLNVLFSRARKQVQVFASFQPDDLSNDQNEGIWVLKQYLKYARAIDVNDEESRLNTLALLSGRIWNLDQVKDSLTETSKQTHSLLESNLNNHHLKLKRLMVGGSDDIFFQLLRGNKPTQFLLQLESDECSTWKEVVTVHSVLEKRGYTVIRVSTQELARDASGLALRVSEKLKETH